MENLMIILNKEDPLLLQVEIQPLIEIISQYIINMITITITIINYLLILINLLILLFLFYFLNLLITFYLIIFPFFQIY